LHVTEWHAGVEGGGDEGVAQRARPDSLGDLGPAGDAPYDPTGGVAVESVTVGIDEDRSLEPLAEGEIDGPGDAAAAAW
jgi:hypothetical protein